jgi:hypothetical protein
MPETVSPGEVAHTLGHHHHGGQHAELIEICEAILLAIVAIATAWSGYQTGKWDGRQAHLYGLSTKYRAQENRAATLSGQQRIYDTTTFGFWFQEKINGHERSAALFERRFRPEYRTAFAPWLALDPLNNPKAPAGPIFMPQYHNAAADRAAESGQRAAEAFAEGTDARERGDKYLRNTVLLATVLFMTALAQKFRFVKVRVGLLVVSGILLVIGIVFIATFPRA